MRFNLKVPFAEKDQAKQRGARWDAGRKLWYIEDPLDAGTFSRWAPTPHDPSAVASLPAARRSVSAKVKTEGGTQGVRHFTVPPRVCDCLPWEDCTQCRLPSWPACQGGR